MLYQVPKLHAEDEVVLSMIKELWVDLHQDLEARPQRWMGWLAKNLRARAIQGSNSIEGYHVSTEAAMAAIDGQKPEEADADSWTHVWNYREAMDYVLTLANAPDFSYSKDLIRSLHFLIARAERAKNPGRWRPGSIYVRNDATGETVYEGPPAAELPGLMGELCDHLTRGSDDQTDRIIRAALAHLNLVMIHPFSDGNGRMARCLQTLVLARGGVLNSAFSSIEEYLGRNTSDYYNVLGEVGQGKWHPEHDALPWIRFCLTAHYRQARSVQRRIDRIAQIYAAVESLLAKHKLPERAATPALNAALGYVVRNEDYRREANCSVSIAGRDLKQLVKAGVLHAKGEKRGRSYVAAADLKIIAERYQASGIIPSPYELAKKAN